MKKIWYIVFSKFLFTLFSYLGFCLSVEASVKYPATRPAHEERDLHRWTGAFWCDHAHVVTGKDLAFWLSSLEAGIYVKSFSRVRVGESTLQKNPQVLLGMSVKLAVALKEPRGLNLQPETRLGLRSAPPCAVARAPHCSLLRGRPAVFYWTGGGRNLAVQGGMRGLHFSSHFQAIPFPSLISLPAPQGGGSPGAGLLS